MVAFVFDYLVLLFALWFACVVVICLVICCGFTLWFVLAWLFVVFLLFRF